MLALFFWAMMCVIVNFAPVFLIVLGKEIIYILVLSMMTEVLLHEFYCYSVNLHIIDVCADIIKEFVSAFSIEKSYDALVSDSSSVFFVPSKESIKCLDCVDY